MLEKVEKRCSKVKQLIDKLQEKINEIPNFKYDVKRNARLGNVSLEPKKNPDFMLSQPNIMKKDISLEDEGII